MNLSLFNTRTVHVDGSCDLFFYSPGQVREAVLVELIEWLAAYGIKRYVSGLEGNKL